jgi:tetratricopeptide (TPR) repeat protein
VQLSPDASTYWNTLGAALCRAQLWDEAITALEKSISLGKERDVSNWFFLAQAEFQRGNRDAARRWLDAGERLMNAAAPNSDLRRFRDEAAAAIADRP